MPNVVYVLGLGHSGSTLLDLLLSGHPHVCGVGEARMLTDPTQRQKYLVQARRFACSCRSPFSECPLWRTYVERLDATSSATFEESYLLLLSAFADVVGRDIWMSDSSKERQTLATLKRAFDARRLPIPNLRVIHLVKDVRAFATSIADRDGRRGVLHAIRLCRLWRSETRQDMRFLSRLGLPTLRIGYEDLCLSPEFTIKRICRFLGIEFVADMVVPQPTRGHVAVGNPMRRHPEKSTRLHYDNRWFCNSDVTQAYHLIPGLSRMNREVVYGRTESDSSIVVPPESESVLPEVGSSDELLDPGTQAQRIQAPS